MTDFLENVPVELDRRATVLGELILRRRKIRSLGNATVFEILLDGEFLMSSVVNASEVALATLGLAAWGPSPCRVLVGGLGLGCTAQAALAAPAVRAVDVIELLEPVLEWHRQRLVPLGEQLTSDPRVQLVQGDFFAWAGGDAEPAAPLTRVYDVVLLDIDHSTEFLLQSAHESFYSPEGLAQLAARITPGGVFAFWSSDPQEPELAALLEGAFASVESHEVEYIDPASALLESNAVLVARTPLAR